MLSIKVTPIRRSYSARSTDAGAASAAFWGAVDNWDRIGSIGYRSLDSCPEVVSAVDRISDLAGLMTIQLMENGRNGDVRVRDALAHKIDVEPWSGGTRSSWVAWIVQTLLLAGDGNAVVLPVTGGGRIEDLAPIAPYRVSFQPDERTGYSVLIDGRSFRPDDVLHFRLRPDPTYPWRGSGYRISMRSALQTLAQARETEAGFMSSHWKPSVIIKVDGNAEEFRSQMARDRFLNDYITTEPGKPWLIPGDLMDVKEIRPLSLSDLAVNETVELDKRTVAALLGVPAFLLGVGEYKADAYNSFISSRLLPIMTGIQQELTRKLLVSPNRYFRFSPRQLWAYSLNDLEQTYTDMYVKGLVTGNEVRDAVGMEPLDGLDQLVILENFIPASMIGKQSKLIQDAAGGE